MDKDFIKKGIELIKKADAAYVTTIDPQGFPSTRAMFNLRNGKQFPRLIDFMSQFDDCFSLFFTTNTSSAKIKQIIINPKVSVYICDTKVYHGSYVSGEN